MYPLRNKKNRLTIAILVFGVAPLGSIVSWMTGPRYLSLMLASGSILALLGIVAGFVLPERILNIIDPPPPSTPTFVIKSRRRGTRDDA